MRLKKVFIGGSTCAPFIKLLGAWLRGRGDAVLRRKLSVVRQKPVRKDVGRQDELQ